MVKFFFILFYYFLSKTLNVFKRKFILSDTRNDILSNLVRVQITCRARVKLILVLKQKGIFNSL